MNCFRSRLATIIFSFFSIGFLIFCSWTNFVEGHIGPHTCVDRLKNHIATKLTEWNYPNNFLSYGESCNSSAQLKFESSLFEVYEMFLHGHRNSDSASEIIWHNDNLFESLDKIWNEWRLKSSEEERICNPRRLLACHPIRKTCGCRQEFDLNDHYHKASYESITLGEETVESFNDIDGSSEKVTACRGLDRSNCGWEAPWLGFCHIECIKGHMCIATMDIVASKKCLKCDPSTPYGLDKCIAAGYDIFRSKK